MTLPRFSCRQSDGSPSRSQDLQPGIHPNPSETTPAPEFELAQLNSHPAQVDNRRTVLLELPDDEIRNLLRFALEQQSFQVLEAATGTQAIETAHRRRPAAILLDLDVTDTEPLTVLHRLREWSRTPILALGGRSSTINAVQALDHGANDFIARPFKMDELFARLRAAQRFAPPPAPEIFRTGSLMVDLASRTVTVAERPVKLSETEFSLLRLFVLHAGRVLTHAQILTEIWGAEMLNNVEYLRVYLMALRKKLANPPEPDLFRTERSVGYCLALRSP